MVLWYKQYLALAQKNIKMIAHVFYSVLLTMFFIYGFFSILRNKLMQTILFEGWTLGNLMLFLWLYLAIIIMFFWFYKYYVNWKNINLMYMIFLLALIPRLILSLKVNWVPVSDFANYYYMGNCYINGAYDAIAQTVQGYTIPSFAGLAVLNGTLMRFFSSTLLGTRIINVLLSSFIVIPIFLLGRRYDRRIGIIAAIIFAIYPSNIIFSQVNTNQHGAILCVLLSLNTFLSVISENEISTLRTIFKAIEAGLWITLSFYFHPSWHTHLIALGIFSIILIIDASKYKQIRNKIITLFISFIVIICIFNIAITQLMLNTGLLYSRESFSFGAKIYVGFNPQTYGGYSQEDYEKILTLPAEQRNKVALTSAFERILQNNNLPAFWMEKIKRMWFLPDESFFWYNYGIEASLSQSSESNFYEINAQKTSAIKMNVDALSWLDYLFCLILYLLAGISTLFHIKDLKFMQMDLLMLVLLGWIAIHLFSEIQTRYRYLGMPIIILLAAIGLVTIIENIKKIKSRRTPVTSKR